MSKTYNCLKLLQLLNVDNVIKSSELATLLDINPRNIIEYIRELEDLGYRIISVPGRYGGYKLDSSVLIPALKLTESEKKILLDCYNYCIVKPDFLNKELLMKSFSKILSNIRLDVEKENLISLNKINANFDSEIENKYNIVEHCIQSKNVLTMEYRFLNEPLRRIRVHPYNLFMYDNEWRFFAWFEEKCEVWYFKLSRIKNMDITPDKFKIWKGFKLEDYLKNNVFVSNGEMFKIVLKAKGIRAKLFSEKLYGTNQKIDVLNDNEVIVSLEMQKNYSTYNFLLGCGDLIEVLEPSWLRKKLKEIAFNIYNSY